MPEPYKDMAPILDMFTVMLRGPKVANLLKNWKETLSRGMLNFGTKERLNAELDFNLLFYSHLHPTASKSGNRVFLDIDMEIAGIVTNKAYKHLKPNHLVTEMLIVKAAGRWDYFRNNRFLNLSLRPDATLCIPPDIEPDMNANAGKYIHEIARHCALWLLTATAVEKAKAVEKGKAPAAPAKV
jgi:hypothetical protein